MAEIENTSINNSDPKIAAAEYALRQSIARTTFAADIYNGFQEINATETERYNRIYENEASATRSLASLGQASGFILGFSRMNAAASEAAIEREQEAAAGLLENYDSVLMQTKDKLLTESGDKISPLVEMYNAAVFAQIGEDKYNDFFKQNGVSPGEYKLYEILGAAAVQEAARSQIPATASEYVASRIFADTFFSSYLNHMQKENMGEIYAAATEIRKGIGDDMHKVQDKALYMDLGAMALDYAVEWPVWTLGGSAIGAVFGGGASAAAKASETGSKAMLTVAGAGALTLASCSSTTEGINPKQEPTFLERASAAAELFKTAFAPDDEKVVLTTPAVATIVGGIMPDATPKLGKYADSLRSSSEEAVLDRLCKDLAYLQQMSPTAESIRYSNGMTITKEELASRIIDEARIVDQQRYAKFLLESSRSLSASEFAAMASAMAQKMGAIWEPSSEVPADAYSGATAEQCRKQTALLLSMAATMDDKEKAYINGKEASRADLIHEAAALCVIEQNIDYCQSAATLESRRIEALGDIPTQCKEIERSCNEKLGLGYKPTAEEAQLPLWMQNAPASELIRYSRELHGWASAMHPGQKKTFFPPIPYQPEELSREQALFRAKLAAQAAQEKHSVEQSQPLQENIAEGWGEKLASMLDADGFFDHLLRNPGPTLAMLPDMIAGGLAGDNELMSSQHAAPLMLIMGSMLTSDKSTKSMMMTAGAALMANASRKEQGRLDMLEERNKYKIYPNEELDPRIANVQLNGNRLALDIDGRPVVLDISEETARAVACGAVPQNVLANRMLSVMDRQQQEAARAYEAEQGASRGPSIVLR